MGTPQLGQNFEPEDNLLPQLVQKAAILLPAPLSQDALAPESFAAEKMSYIGEKSLLR